MHKPCIMSGVYHTCMLANGCTISQSFTGLVSKHAIFCHIDLHIHLDIRLSKTILPSRFGPLHYGIIFS